MNVLGLDIWWSFIWINYNMDALSPVWLKVVRENKILKCCKCNALTFYCISPWRRNDKTLTSERIICAKFVWNWSKCGSGEVKNSTSLQTERQTVIRKGPLNLWFRGAKIKKIKCIFFQRIQKFSAIISVTMFLKSFWFGTFPADFGHGADQW